MAGSERVNKMDLPGCLLTLTSVTLVQREVSSELLSVILTSKEGSRLGPAIVESD